MPHVQSPSETRRRTGLLSAAGVLLILSGVAGLIAGLMLVDSLTRETRATLDVTRSALTAIGDTVELAGDLSDETTDVLDSASSAASSAAEATRGVSEGIEELSGFLDDELPTDIEAIRLALPGAIGAADAIDTTLGALSLFGADYEPDEPFGDSLRRIEAALEELPGEVRSQSQTLRAVSPSTARLAGDIQVLAGDLDEVNSALAGVDGLTDQYATTVSDAETALAATDDSLTRTVLFLRVLVAIAALGAVVVGASLLVIERRLADISQRVAVRDSVTIPSSLTSPNG